MLKLQTICRLGQDAIVNQVNGKNVINFNAAYSEKYKNQDGTEVNNTTWLNCAYWVDRTTIASYLKKGIQIYLEGKPDVRIYTNKQGQPVGQIQLKVTYIKLLSSNDKDEQANPQQQLPVAADDDMPF